MPVSCRAEGSFYIWVTPHPRLYNRTMPSVPVRLDETGVDALRQHLKDTVTGRKVPAAWFGVTSANEELFFDCQGERVFGKPNEGMVDEHTSGFRLVDRTDPSPTAVLDDQVCHDGECHV
jgi:hypothetical protein